MAAITSTTTGNWSAGATWIGGVAPNVAGGDTVVLNHATTCDVNYIIGTSPSDQTTFVITGANDITLTVAAGVTLTVRGNSKFQRAGGVTLSAGATWKFDASQATTTTTRYLCDLNAGFISVGKLTLNGSSGSHCAVTSDAGGGNGKFVATNGPAGPAGTGYADFTRVGDASNSMMAVNPTSGLNAVLSHCTLSGTLEWVNQAPLDSGWSITDCTWSGGAYRNLSDGNTTPCPLKLNTVAGAGTGTRTVARITFDERPNIVGNGGSYDAVTFVKGWYDGTNGSAKGTMTNCFTRQVATNATNAQSYDTVSWDVTNLYVLKDTWPMTPLTTVSAGNVTGVSGTSITCSGTPFPASTYISDGSGNSYAVLIADGSGHREYRQVTGNTTSGLTLKLGLLQTFVASTTTLTVYKEGGNCHYLAPNTIFAGSSGSPVTVTLSGVIFEYNGADGNGDCFLHGDAQWANFWLKNCLSLRNYGRDNSGTLYTTYQRSTARNGELHSLHNTYFTGSQSAAVGENSTGTNVDPLTEHKACIAWCDQVGSYYGSSLGPYVLCTSGTLSSTVNNPSGSVDYNGKWNNLAGSAGGGYNATLANAAGAHDVSGDPQFVDPNRTFAGWAVVRGSSGTTVAAQTADGLAYLEANPTLISSSLLPYFWAGFAPQNAAYNTTYPGDTNAVTNLGAVAGSFNSITTTETQIEASVTGQTLHVTITGGTASSTADFTLSGTGAAVTGLSNAGATPILTVTGPSSGASTTLTHVPTGATTTITVFPTPSVAPSSSATSTGATLAANLTNGQTPFTYAWSGTGITFSNSAVANPTATVAAAGTYTAALNVTDANGATATGSTSFTVTQVNTSVVVSPTSAAVVVSGTTQLSAAVRDQFGNAVAGQTFTWAVTVGTGTINASGLFTAPASAESDTVRATSGALNGTAAVSVALTAGGSVTMNNGVHYRANYLQSVTLNNGVFLKA